MKTLRKKLFLSILAVAFAVVSLATSTFAWFAINETVEATGMTVTALADSRFLQIKVAGEAAFTDAAQTTVAASNASNTIKPTVPGASVAQDHSSYTAFSCSAPATLVWVSANSADPTSPTAKANSYTDVTTGAENANGYVLKNQFDIRLKPQTTEVTASNLVVSNVTLTPNAAAEPQGGTDTFVKAVRVLVVGTDGAQIWTNASGTMAAAASGNASALINSLSSNTAKYTVTVYVYFDGTDANCYTNNALVAQGINANYTVTVEFHVG